MAAYYTLNGAGDIVWRMADQELYNWHAHADRVVAGRFAEDSQASPRIVFTAGNHGLFFLDATSGRLLHHVEGIGHCQNIVAGNFFHDRPGQEVWVVNDWGSCGIQHIYDMDGRCLLRQQMNPRVIWLAPIRWLPGCDLLLPQETPQMLGIWNGSGQRVIDLYAERVIPASLKPTATGIPHAMPLAPLRLPGEETDHLAAVADGKLMLFAPADIVNIQGAE